MRIGFDISPIRAPRTGVGNYCYYLLRHLLEREPALDVRGFASGTAPVALDALAGRVPYRYIPIPTRALYAWWSAARWPGVDTLLGGVDVYHATNYYLPPVESARCAVTFYDLSFMTVPETSSPKIRAVFGKNVPKFAKKADAILVCSESTRRDIVRLLGVDPARIHVAYGAVDEDVAPWDRQAAMQYVVQRHGVSGPYILFVGTLEPRKNLPVLIRAFAAIARDIPHTLVLAGVDGWHIEQVDAAIAASGVAGRIVRTGYVGTTRDLAALYSGADLFAFPSVYEGFGLPVVEAMTCGCPVICADNSSLPEVAGDAAVLVEAEDAEALSAAMARVLGDAALREAMVVKGRAQAARFSWAGCAAATLDVYRKLAKA